MKELREVVGTFAEAGCPGGEASSYDVIVLVNDEGSVFVDGDDEGYMAPCAVQTLGNSSYGWGLVDPDPSFLSGDVPFSGIPEMQPLPRI